MIIKWLKAATRASLAIVALAAATACTDDKGNYDYEPKAEVTIKLPESITVLANAEYIDLKPEITSTLEGEITDANPNFEFSFKYKDSNGNWVELNQESKKDIYMLATIGIGKHVCWYSVTDKRTGVRYSAVVDVKIVVSTSEGWMLLGEKPDGTVRLDMISSLTIDRLMPVYDIDLYTDIKPLHHARSLGTFFNARGTIGDKIVLMSEDNAYLLNNTYLTINGDAYELKTSHFVSLPDDHIVSFRTVPCSNFITADAVIAVSLEGNAFVWNPWDTGGGAFEEPINTSERAKEPEYRVSPFIGTSATRAEILKKLVTIKYLSLNNKTQVITPTYLGELIYEVVDASIKQLLNPELTASWEKGLTYVAEGTITSDEYMQKLERFVAGRTYAAVQTANLSGLRGAFAKVEQNYKKLPVKGQK